MVRHICSRAFVVIAAAALSACLLVLTAAGEPLQARRRLHEATLLLERLMLQDIERGEDGTRLKRGVSPDRIVCVHDSEMRGMAARARGDASTGTRRIWR